MRTVFVSIALLAVAAAMPLDRPDLTAAAAADKITDLPGAPKVSFDMYSGYIDVDAASSTKKSLFYWFVTADAENAADLPVVLWTNGGPGCSGLGGFLTEQGPFRPTANGTGLKVNPASWNRAANMIFIEQPAGVGFSTVDGKIPYGDAMAASDNYDLLVGFLERFPQYKSNKLFISSESYGGHYMPTLAAEILERGGLPNFNGFFVGNPLTYMPYRDYGQFGTLWNHQLLPKPLWDRYVKAGCQQDDSSSACGDIMYEMSETTAGLDPYALDFPMCNTPAATGRDDRHALLSAIARAHPHPHVLKSYFPASYDMCSENWAADYLNRADVQKAIHVAPGITWALCNNAINAGYNTTDVAAPMMPVYKKLIASKKIRIEIYSGDDDSVCATLGSQQFIWDLGLKINTPWAAWKTPDGQTAGYTVDFEGLRFSTVHGAGHMVPATRPDQAYQLFSTFIQG